MTEYELLEIQAIYQEALGDSIMNFISILSGYLLATYFVGSKLKAVQFIILSATYSVVMLIMISAVEVSYAETLAAEVALENVGRTWESQKGIVSLEGNVRLKNVLVATHILIFFGSIYFAVVSRTKDARQAVL